jgi:hypothetical protein
MAKLGAKPTSGRYCRPPNLINVRQHGQSSVHQPLGQRTHGKRLLASHWAELGRPDAISRCRWRTLRRAAECLRGRRQRYGGHRKEAGLRPN